MDSKMACLWCIHHNHNFVVFALLLVSVLNHFNAVVSAQNLYCSAEPQDHYILTNRKQRIVTLEQGDQFYTHNATCVYPIETMDSYRIKLTVELSDLYIPDSRIKSYCEVYDHVDIIDGENKKLVTWCGRDHPKEIISPGKALKVVFKANDDSRNNGNHRGVRIRIQIFANTTCPPGWLEFNNSCYSTTSARQSWHASQQECNRRQSNLLSVDFKGSLTFLFKEVLNKSSELYMWTGLNGLVKDKRLTWVDKSSPAKIKGFDIPPWNDLRRCGMIHTKQAVVYMQDCSRNTMYALCQSLKDGVTPLYPITVTADTEYGVASDNSGEIVLAVCGPIIGIVLLAVVIYVMMDKLGYSCGVSCPLFGASKSAHKEEEHEPEQLNDFLPSTSRERRTSIEL